MGYFFHSFYSLLFLFFFLCTKLTSEVQPEPLRSGRPGLNGSLTLWVNEERQLRVLFVITLMFSDTFALWVEMCH